MSHNIRKIILLNIFFVFAFSLQPSALSPVYTASKGNPHVAKHVIARTRSARSNLRDCFVSLAMTVDNWLCTPLYAASKGNPPVAHWRFDEGGGGTAYDDTTNNNDGTLNATPSGTNTSVGQMWTRQGKIGGALECDGTDDYVNCGNSSAINFTSNGTFSISIWVKPNTLTSAWRRGIISQEAYLTSGYRFGFANGGTPIFWTNQSGGTLSVSGGTLAVDQWNHIEVTYDNQQAYLYLNGVQTGSATGTYVAGTNNLRLGYFVNEYFSGLIDDVRIYNYARTADQILVDYNAGAAAYLGAGTDPNEGNPPVAYYKFDENTGTILYDRSGNGNNSTQWNGSPVWGHGRFGSALNFDGTGTSGIEINSPTGLNSATFTAEVWVDGTDQVGVVTRILNWGTNGSNYGGWIIGMNDNGTLRTYLDTSGTGGWSSLNSIKAVNDGQWHYLVLVYDGTNRKIYIDGVFDTSDAPAGYNSSPASPILTIGQSTYDHEEQKGKIDEVKIYSYARTQAQIAYDYNKGKPVAHYKFDEGGGAISHNEYSSADTGIAPIGWWRFDAGTGTSCVDSSGNSLTATAGTATWTSGKIGPYGLNNTSATVIDNSLLEGMSSLTISAWVYPTILEGTDRRIVEKGLWENADMSYRLMYQTDWGSGPGYPNGYWNFHIKTSTGNYNANGPNGVSADRKNMWHYIVGVLDGSAGKVRIYDNGILIGESTASGTINTNTYNTLIWSAAVGIVDDVRIYNYARTAEQIYNDYKTTHGTLVGDTKFMDGKIGKAVQMDGTGDYILANNLNLDISKDFTAEAWVNPSITQTSNARILSYAQDANNGLSLVTDIDLGNKFLFEVKKGGSNYGGNGIVYSTNTWYHLAGVFTAATNSTVLYVNGVAQGTGPAALTLPPTTGFLYVGCRGDSSYWNGKVDDVKIYNYSRTANQVLQDYNAGMSSHASTSTGVADPWGGALPVGHWKLDENTGVLANDASGNGNNGTLTNGPAWAQGKVGQCLNFTRANGNYVKIEDNNILDISGSFSVSAWIRPDDLGASDTIIAKRDYTAGDANYSLRVDSGKLRLFWYNGPLQDCLEDTASIATGTWCHVAGVYNGTNSIIYVNGRETKRTSPTAAPLANNNPFAIGAAYASGAGDKSELEFNGKIDDVRLYNYARTQAQITWDYNKGKPAGYWRFDEISGATCYDDSGNNNGTATIGGTGTQTTIAAARTNGATGKFGKCMSFDGTDDYVSCGNGASLNITNTVTIEAWIKANSWATTGGVSLGVFAWKSGAYGIAFNTSGSVGGIFYRTGGTPLYIMPSSGVLNTGQWYHVAGVYDGSNAYTYVDGKLVNSASYSGTLVSNSNNLMIGGFTTDRHFNGFVDDARVYNYTRTADQILQDYNQGLAAKMGE